MAYGDIPNCNCQELKDEIERLRGVLQVISKMECLCADLSCARCEAQVGLQENDA